MAVAFRGRTRFVQVQGDMLLFPEFKRADGDPVFIGWLANCGDGRALNVKAIGINCDAEVWDCRQIGETVLGEQTKWIMNNTGRIVELTNETMRFWVTITPPRDSSRDIEPDLTKLELGVHWYHLQLVCAGVDIDSSRCWA